MEASPDPTMVFVSMPGHGRPAASVQCANAHPGRDDLGHCVG